MNDEAREKIAKDLPRLWCHECPYMKDCKAKEGVYCKRQYEYANKFIKIAREGYIKKPEGEPPLLTDEEIKNALVEVEPVGFDWGEMTQHELIKYRTVTQAQRASDIKWGR